MAQHALQDASLICLLLDFTLGVPLHSYKPNVDDVYLEASIIPAILASTILVALVLVVIGCVCCPHHGLKALGHQNGMPVPRRHDNYNNQNENTSEFTIFPPPSVTVRQPVSSLNEKVTFEPLPEIHTRISGHIQGSLPPRPAHLNGVLNKRISLHDWFEVPSNCFPRSSLQYLKEVGSGWFGKVVEGEAYNIVPGQPKTLVVVKILREDASPSEHIYFLHEVRPFRDLIHPNIICLLGYCLESDPFLVIMEQLTMDLKTYLIQKRKDSDSLQNGLLIFMARSIAEGLQHMHEHGYIHTDLAARNCHITDDLTVKIGDYGTSIQNFKEDYYCLGDIALPIRWSAPESLHCTDTTVETKEITREANVWTLGVVLWELLEFGTLPYVELSDEEVLQKVFLENSSSLERPKSPSIHKEQIYQIMKLCWKSPNSRPSVQKITALLNHLYELKDVSSDSASFEVRWNVFQPMNKEHNLLQSTAVELQFENDFVSKSGPDLSDQLSSEFSSHTESVVWSSSHDILSASLGVNSSVSPSLQTLRGSTDDLCYIPSDEHSAIVASGAGDVYSGLSSNSCHNAECLHANKDAIDDTTVFRKNLFVQQQSQKSITCHTLSEQQKISLQGAQDCNTILPTTTRGREPFKEEKLTDTPIFNNNTNLLENFVNMQKDESFHPLRLHEEVFLSSEKSFVAENDQEKNGTENKKSSNTGSQSTNGILNFNSPESVAFNAAFPSLCTLPLTSVSSDYSSQTRHTACDFQENTCSSISKISACEKLNRHSSISKHLDDQETDSYNVCESIKSPDLTKNFTFVLNKGEPTSSLIMWGEETADKRDLSAVINNDGNPSRVCTESRRVDNIAKTTLGYPETSTPVKTQLEEEISDRNSTKSIFYLESLTNYTKDEELNPTLCNLFNNNDSLFVGNVEKSTRSDETDTNNKILDDFELNSSNEVNKKLTVNERNKCIEGDTEASITINKLQYLNVSDSVGEQAKMQLKDKFCVNLKEQNESCNIQENTNCDEKTSEKNYLLTNNFLGDNDAVTENNPCLIPPENDSSGILLNDADHSEDSYIFGTECINEKNNISEENTVNKVCQEFNKNEETELVNSSLEQSDFQIDDKMNSMDDAGSYDGHVVSHAFEQSNPDLTSSSFEFISPHNKSGYEIKVNTVANEDVLCEPEKSYLKTRDNVPEEEASSSTGRVIFEGKAELEPFETEINNDKTVTFHKNGSEAAGIFASTSASVPMLTLQQSVNKGIDSMQNVDIKNNQILAHRWEGKSIGIHSAPSQNDLNGKEKDGVRLAFRTSSTLVFPSGYHDLDKKNSVTIVENNNFETTHESFCELNKYQQDKEAEVSFSIEEEDSITEDLKLSPKLVVSHCESYQDHLDYDDVLRVDTETNEALLLDSSESIIGFVPTRSTELLQEHALSVIAIKEIPSPPHISDKHSVNFQPLSCQSLDNLSPSSSSAVCSGSDDESSVTTKGDYCYLHKDFLPDSCEHTTPQNIEVIYHSEDEVININDRRIVNNINYINNQKHFDKSSDTKQGYLEYEECDNSVQVEDIAEDVVTVKELSKSICWSSNDSLSLDNDTVGVIIEGKEILAGGNIDGIEKQDKSALSSEVTSDLEPEINSEASESAADGPSLSTPSSGSEPGSPAREMYTPDFESDSDETTSTGTSCSSTSGSFECIHNKFRQGAADEGSKINQNEEAAEFQDMLESSPLKVFSGVWDRHATPTRSSMKSPEKKVMHMKKSVSFNEEDPPFVFSYPPASDGSEDGDYDDDEEIEFVWHSDYTNYADWELQVGDEDEIPEDIIEAEDADQDDNLAFCYKSLPLRPLHGSMLYTLTGLSDEDFDSDSRGFSQFAPDISPRESMDYDPAETRTQFITYKFGQLDNEPFMEMLEDYPTASGDDKEINDTQSSLQPFEFHNTSLEVNYSDSSEDDDEDQKTHLLIDKQKDLNYNDAHHDPKFIYSLPSQCNDENTPQEIANNEEINLEILEDHDSTEVDKDDEISLTEDNLSNSSGKSLVNQDIQDREAPDFPSDKLKSYGDHNKSDDLCDDEVNQNLEEGKSEQLEIENEENNIDNCIALNLSETLDSNNIRDMICAIEENSPQNYFIKPSLTPNYSEEEIEMSDTDDKDVGEEKYTMERADSLIEEAEAFLLSETFRLSDNLHTPKSEHYILDQHKQTTVKENGQIGHAEASKHKFTLYDAFDDHHGFSEYGDRQEPTVTNTSKQKLKTEFTANTGYDNASLANSECTSQSSEFEAQCNSSVNTAENCSIDKFVVSNSDARALSSSKDSAEGDILSPSLQFDFHVLSDKRLDKSNKTLEKIPVGSETSKLDE